MTRPVTLAGIAAVSLLSAAIAVAKTPFGGDDTGFVPPDTATAKCENGVAKLSSKLVGAFFKCHIKMASASLKLMAPQDDEGCETTARAKYDAATAKLTGCPSCLNPGMIADSGTSQIEGLANGALYCAGTTPYGGDDMGNIPPDAASAKCENTAVKLVTKLVGALVKCHIAQATASLKAGIGDLG